MKGRNSSCITVRLEDSVVCTLQKEADEKGLTLREYIKELIVNRFHSVHAIKPECIQKGTPSKEWHNPFLREGRAEKVIVPKWLDKPTKSNTPNPVMATK